MNLTLVYSNGGGMPLVVPYRTIAEALTDTYQYIDELDQVGDVYLTSASDGTESNLSIWVHHGLDTEDLAEVPDYPDEIWRVEKRRRPCPFRGAWIVKRERL